MLKKEAIRSAQIYLDYLQAHRDTGLGVVRATVRGMQPSLLGNEMVLYTDRVMRSAESIVMRVGGTLYENTSDVIHFKVQSINRRKVIIEPSEELAEHIESAWEEKVPIILETDLTFLVKRVKSWYEKYGDQVALPSGKPCCRLDPQNPIPLSDDQYACAEMAMSYPLSYIWGAPGTGKTKHVLASCILSYIRAGKKVVLVAPTNNALEQSLFGLLRALSQEGGISPAGKVIRLGIPGEVFHTVWKEVCMDGATDWLRANYIDKIDGLKDQNSWIDQSLAFRKGEAKEDAEDPYPHMSLEELKAQKKSNIAKINNLLNKNRILSEGGIMKALSEFNVVAATMDTCLAWIKPEGDFEPEHVFLDEAGYCCVIKGMTLLGFDKPVTMLGDHMQLPPVFEGEKDLLEDPDTQITRLWQISTLYMENVVRCDNLNEFCAKDPDKPEFDQTIEGDLVETHRFGPELAKILAGKVYGPKFCSRSANETQILFLSAPKITEDKEKEEGKNKWISRNEVKNIRTLLEFNLSHNGYTVGIITPYRNQRRLLSRAVDSLLKRYGIEEDMEDDILTVHGSQGREWDIVIFSVTDSFEEKWLTNSFRLESKKLINTAVSRAKKMLILVGDSDSWRGQYGQLISELFAMGRGISPKERLVECLQEQTEMNELN